MNNPLEYITAVSAGILAALWLLGARVAYHKGRAWFPLFLLGLVLLFEAFLAHGDYIPWFVRVARDCISALVLVTIVAPKRKKDGSYARHKDHRAD